MSKKIKIAFLILFLLVLTLSMLSLSLYNQNKTLKKQIDLEKFNLISPKVALMTISEFQENQKKFNINYQELRKNIEEIINSSNEGSYAMYFEDLNTGAWIGSNERKKFIPFSLFKVPLMMSILKKIEEKEINLNSEIILLEEYYDNRSGELYKKKPGTLIKIEDLMTIMIQESDNTALVALASTFSENEEYYKLLSIMGLPISNEQVLVSPKEYSNIFRSLYISNYLKRPYSQYALSIMMDTKFESQIPSGVPQEVQIAHKVGFDYSGGNFHDCGIIYAERNPYILCLMATNTTIEEANNIFMQISKETYEFVTKKVN
jgi:beta-lactamase class A